MIEWMHQLTFTISKEVDGGAVEKKIKELDSSARVLNYTKQELAPQKEKVEHKNQQALIKPS